MIDKQYDSFYIRCDVCEEVSEEKFDTWQDAVDAKKDLEYTSKKYANGWKDLCKDCNI